MGRIYTDISDVEKLDTNFCPNCDKNVKQYKIYQRINKPKRRWHPVGLICSNCQHLYKKPET